MDNDEMLVSASDGARSVGGTHGENHHERFDNVQRSATLSSVIRSTRQRASKILFRHLVFSMLLTVLDVVLVS